MEREITTRHIGGSVSIIEVKGEHDLWACPDLRAELNRLFETRSRVVVDLSDATFVDPSPRRPRPAGAWLGALPSSYAIEQSTALTHVADTLGYDPAAVSSAFRARYWQPSPTRDTPPTASLER